MTILERIKLNSTKHPERVVMRAQYDFGEMTMTWGELDAFSDKLAYYLTKELKTYKPIIVYGHKHPMMLVCFLACVKSGRAYCPIDVNVPLSRTEAIIQEVEPEIILTTEPLEIDSDRIKGLQDINEIISTVDGRVDSSNYDSFHSRFYGRISELLLDVYLQKNAITYKEVGFIYMEKINKIAKVKGFLAAKFGGKKYGKSF